MMVGVFTRKGTLIAVAQDPPGPHGSRLKLKGRDPDTGRERPFLEHTVRWEFAIDRDQWERVERIFNRQERTYEENYYSPTGEVVYRKVGTIGDQSNHGRRATDR
jgi:hypothetical protein